MNLVLLRGVVVAELQRRDVADGAIAWSFDVMCSSDGGQGRTPVMVIASESDAAAWQPGVEVVVIGSVKRRFFRSGGATQSRTEVVATSVVPARRRKAVSASLTAALARVSVA